MTETIVIYHGACRDGFCAAWVVNKYLQLQRDKWVKDSAQENKFAYYNEPIYYPGFYGQEPPNVKDKDVIIVDFAYQPDVMERIITECRQFIWLDHHKTAQPVADLVERIDKQDKALFINRIHYVFDNNRSGAGIVWDYFFPNEPRPWLVDYVEDRDLWNKNLHGSDEVNAYIACLKFDFDVWDEASHLLVSEAIGYGIIAEKKTEQYVAEVCKNVYLADIYIQAGQGPEEYDGKCYNYIPIVNICQVDCSEVLHELCKIYSNSPFSLYWFKRADGLYQYGLRSIGDFDVSVVAKLFGGGGHKNAAGFQLPYLLEELK